VTGSARGQCVGPVLLCLRYAVCVDDGLAADAGGLL
jgi:hypothetical protein